MHCAGTDRGNATVLRDILPHLMFNRTLNVFDVLPIKEDDFAPSSPVNVLEDASGPVS